VKIACPSRCGLLRLFVASLSSCSLSVPLAAFGGVYCALVVVIDRRCLSRCSSERCLCIVRRGQLVLALGAASCSRGVLRAACRCSLLVLSGADPPCSSNDSGVNIQASSGCIVRVVALAVPLRSRCHVVLVSPLAPRSRGLPSASVRGPVRLFCRWLCLSLSPLVSCCCRLLLRFSLIRLLLHVYVLVRCLRPRSAVSSMVLVGSRCLCR